ncbi:divalent-cation tolerance protein CutA [Sulfurovum sp.]|uniref:divalent-cation tolerance protein CutA n=1 Tax=Sulfurovum sp. TaxID=1969726 RepID=UPI002867C6CA|nr:divalent-cation tolerance protein CutA [Sulfurovum sp.]
MKPSECCMITTTTDRKENADIITEALLQKHLVACVQYVNIESSYSWDGKIVSSTELLLQMKTKTSFFKEIKDEIERLHTYDVPEIVMVPLLDANFSYMKWINEETLEKLGDEVKPLSKIPTGL